MKIKVSTRLVFIFCKVAVKIPFDKRGYLQGKNERKMWNKYKHLNLLMPFIGEFCGIVIQRRCHSYLTEIDLDAVERMKRSIPDFDIENCDLYNFRNWGVYHNNIVLLDYGINERISKMYKK